MAEGWVEKHTLDGMEFYLNTQTEEVSWQKPEALMTDEEREGNAGEWVWVPHKEKLWQPGKIVKRDNDETVHVESELNGLMKIPPSRMMNDKHTGGRKQEVPLWPLRKSNLRFLEDDLVMLDPVNEAFIIYNLQKRYEDGEIYTWVGAGHSVLVSVNPYKEMDLYGTDTIELHRNKPPNKPLPPHVFDVANDSFDSMAFNGVNQSVLISGESGAGKTEATKQCLKYLANIAGSENNIEERVLVANPLLEAFGNAKTIRNINSSRFGKWMEVYFDKKTTEMRGSKIINYLLERSRVVYQQKDERNYHIFYALFADEAIKSKYNLSTPEDYQYLSQSGCINVPEFNDKENYKEVINAMDLLSFSDEEKESVLQLTVAVLNLGNMEFDGKEMEGQVDGSVVKTQDVLNTVADLLEIDSETLTKVLTFRTISAGAGKRSDSATIPLDKNGARTASDSLAMGVYGKLFQWLVNRVNESLGDQDREKNRFLGILDIFGFEIFENNSFEQLCINYANEKLQQLFNNTTFKEEEQLYQSEGVEYTHIDFIDNQVVLDVVEQKPHGILPCLDDEILIPGGDDKKFMNKIEDFHGGKPQFLTDPKRRFKNLLSFEIVHYAGVVKYDASKFMEKNVDTIFGDMHDALGSSKNKLLVQIFEGSDRTIRTLSKQFRGQLDDLMEVLYKTESRFIRCIKPNNEMSANKFVARSCSEQLRYSGVYEAVNIRKTGYPFRYKHRQFVYRYSCINPNHKYASRATLDDDPVPYVKEILSVSKQNFDNVQIGKTMVLYRANEYKILKLLRNLALETLIPRAQSVIRGGILRNYRRVLLNAEDDIEKAIQKADDYKMISEAIENSSNVYAKEQLKLFDYKPRNLAVAKIMMVELENWLSLEEKMKKLADVEDPNPYYEDLKALDAEITETIEKHKAAADNAEKDFYERVSYRPPKMTSSQKELRSKIKEQLKKCVLGILDKDMKAALDAYDRDAMLKCLERADELKHDTEDIRKARELIVKMEELDEDAYKASRCVSSSMIKEVLQNAEDLKQNTEPIKKCRELENLDERSFVEAEYKRAKEVGDEERRIHREIRLMELKYEDADAKSYHIENVPLLRTRMEFAKSPKQQQMMLVWEKKTMKNSLIKPAAEGKAEQTPEDKARMKEFKKESKNLFKNILMFMGDKKSKDPNAAAMYILQRGIQAVQEKDDETLREIYMLIIKQLRGNPTELSSSPETDARTSPETGGTSFQNGLALLGMCLTTFPPSTEPFSHTERTFDDYVAIFILNTASFGGQKNQKKYMSALHNTKYSKPKSSVPNPASLRSAFANTKGEFSIDYDADSGPKEDKIPLYLKEAAAVEENEEV